MFTQLMDMHSGGGQKENFAYCYIEASEEEAALIFYNRFGHSPYRVTCTCCGQDYSLTESATLGEATAYNRGCMWKGNGYIEQGDPTRTWQKYQTLDEYLKSPDVLVIYEQDIKPEEREGELPVQGYVWAD